MFLQCTFTILEDKGAHTLIRTKLGPVRNSQMSQTATHLWIRVDSPARSNSVRKLISKNESFFQTPHHSSGRQPFSSFSIFWTTRSYRNLRTSSWISRTDNECLSGTFHLVIPERSGRIWNDLVHTSVVMRDDNPDNLDDACCFVPGNRAFGGWHLTDLKTWKYCRLRLLLSLSKDVPTGRLGDITESFKACGNPSSVSGSRVRTDSLKRLQFSLITDFWESLIWPCFIQLWPL